MTSRSNSRGRAWLPIRSTSAKPRLTSSSVRSPLRSSSALVATVVPIFTASTTPGGIGASERDAEHRLDAGDGGVAVAAGVLAQQLVGRQPPVGIARDDVGEGAAAIDPELPARHLFVPCAGRGECGGGMRAGGFCAPLNLRHDRSEIDGPAAMSYWGKIIGGVAGFAMGGPFGAVVGAALGHAADGGAMPNMRRASEFGFSPARVAALLGRRDQLFAISVVVLAAKLAKCDGPVKRAEIDAFKRQFRIPPEVGARHRPAVRPGARQRRRL